MAGFSWRRIDGSATTSVLSPRCASAPAGASSAASSGCRASRRVNWMGLSIDPVSMLVAIGPCRRYLRRLMVSKGTIGAQIDSGTSTRSLRAA